MRSPPTAGPPRPFLRWPGLLQQDGLAGHPAETIPQMIRPYLLRPFLHPSWIVREMMILRMIFLTRMRILKCGPAAFPLVGGKIPAGLARTAGRDGSTRVTLPAMPAMLRDAVNGPGMSRRQKNTLTNILRLLVNRSAGADWRLPGAHKPGRQSFAGGEPADGPGVDDHGRNGPGPPNAAKLRVYA